ncbi:MAG: hypothetical protein D6698_09510 [Gammaproteobacteria bacterium]|nr:MAG: hypothetical protein D6698_09510 [Gammaproteobacteria bacterium]
MKFALLCLALGLIAGCATAPPANVDNICQIFREKPRWYRYTLQSYKKWGVPVHVQMAILHQESRYDGHARPARKHFLGIPTVRPSSAYGYAQVKDETWDWYRRKTGHWTARRDDFEDAVDFVGWYGLQTYLRLRISKWDAKNLYLAYHEGHGGYEQKTFQKKPWLIHVADKVEYRARRFRKELATCRASL